MKEHIDERENPKNTYYLGQSVNTAVTSHQRPVVNLGAVYTPALLATWVARELLKHLPSRGKHRILDPACGDGALLAAIVAEAGYPINLIGIDVDEHALSRARLRLSAAVPLHQADSLGLKGKSGSIGGWRALLGKGSITGIIANPPWGADIGYSRSELKTRGYTLAKGQYDSFEIFIEGCMSIASKNSILAFIVPDSLFLPEHQSLRELLLHSSELLLIARLGEGFFPNVYRGTAIVLVRKGKPRENHSVECLRLTQHWRRLILSGERTLDEAKHNLSHHVHQTRFLQDPSSRFDIDVKENEEGILNTLSESTSSWVKWVTSGRGVEISKFGKIIICPICKTAYPSPRSSKSYKCGICKHQFETTDAEQQYITRSLKGAKKGWHPFIAGEDVDRYSCIPARDIRVGVPGINYKDADQFKARKLLIRKTGIGIKAAIDESGAYTNQVVFHYVPKDTSAPPFLLDYLLGVLCSRVLYAYHLKRVGESEWRSHPYITQKVISTFPIPDICEGNWTWSQAKAIAGAVKKRMTVHNNGDQDIYIDCLVAGLYGLSATDCTWILRVLNEAQPLEPVRALRLIDQSSLKPIRIN